MKPEDYIPVPEKAIAEVTSLRVECGKHFLMRDGNFRASISEYPVHYKENPDDEKAKWLDVDTTIPPNLKVTKAQHITQIFSDRIGYSYTSRRGGGVTVELRKVGGSRNLALNSKPPIIDGHTCKWENVAPDLDIVLFIYPYGVEFFKILRSEAAPVTFEWSYTYTEAKHIRMQVETRATDSSVRKAVREKDMPEYLRRSANIKCSTKTWVQEDGSKVSRLFEEFTGEVKVRDPRTRVARWEKGLTEYPVVVDATVSEVPGDGDDDTGVSHFSTASVSSSLVSQTASSIKLGKGTVYNQTYFQYNQLSAGFRFQTIGITNGSTINTASITLKKASGTNSLSLTAFVDNVDDAAAWGTGLNMPHRITRFPAFGKAVNLNSATTGAPGSTWTLDAKTMVQQIVNRAGWTTGNDMRFFFAASASTGYDKVWAYEKGGANRPVLDIDYSGAPVAVGNELQTIWDVALIVNNTHQSVWNVAKSEGAEIQTVWNVIANAGQELGVQWNVAANVFDTLQLDWNVYTPLGNELDLQWSVTGTAANELQAIWNVIAQVNNELQSIWNVYTPLNNELELQWSQAALASNTIEAQWNVIARVTNELQALWNVYTPLNNELGLQWDVRTAVGGERQFIWNSAALATQDLQAIWNVYTPLSNELDVQWSVAQKVGAETQYIWNVVGQVFNDLQAVWQTYKTVGAEIEVDWQVFLQVIKDLQTIWNTATPVGSDSQLVWNVASTAGNNLQPIWNVYIPAGNATALEWAVKQAVGSEIEADWTVIGQAGASVQLVWTTYSSSFPPISIALTKPLTILRRRHIVLFNNQHAGETKATLTTRGRTSVDLAQV